ncbi:hypothetical protein DQK91_22150 [Oceanidesulfovibrio marinus]|uniref:Uncharacterized protein n=1 Tax=Oceanidesulfovibrio marinus TaxID=370038 RepID=A0A6P1Z9F7_9BACT|nr:hypothetical protein DQK91_22150 [Oceanidesulfovibrio marinus]
MLSVITMFSNFRNHLLHKDNLIGHKGKVYREFSWSFKTSCISNVFSTFNEIVHNTFLFVMHIFKSGCGLIMVL